MNLLGLFVKFPAAGAVKTRLARNLGGEQAAALYAAIMADLIDLLRRTADRRILGYAPDTPAAAEFFRDLAGGDFDLWPQPAGPLGARMQRFFAHHLTDASDRAVLIGSDSPTLPRDVIERAFDSLDSADCVLGPAADGGYCLVGQRGSARPIFENIDWSSPNVLEQTVERIAELQLRLAVLPPWYDIDTLDDLQTLRGHLRALEYAGTLEGLERTAAFLCPGERGT